MLSSCSEQAPAAEPSTTVEEVGREPSESEREPEPAPEVLEAVLEAEKPDREPQAAAETATSVSEESAETPSEESAETPSEKTATSPFPESASELSLEDAVGQVMMIGFRGYSLDGEVEALLSGIRPGGVVLFDYDGPSKGEIERNIQSPEQLRALTEELQNTSIIPLFVAIDAEGGLVNRLKEKYGFPLVVPSAAELGEGSVAETKRIASELAAEFKEAGLNWNFAPVVDVNVNPDSPAIGKLGRAFSSDPEVTSAHALAFIEGLRQHGVISTLKHFPGHGSAGGDTHLGVTDVTETYMQETELAPYETLIAGGYADGIMTAHIVNRSLDATGRPGTLSHPIITELLRERLGFEGVIISDDMQMGAIVKEYGLAEAAVAALQAGVDMILLANQAGEYDLGRVHEVRDAIIAAVEDGSILTERIYEAAGRILALKKRYRIS